MIIVNWGRYVQADVPVFVGPQARVMRTVRKEQRTQTIPVTENASYFCLTI